MSRSGETRLTLPGVVAESMRTRVASDATAFVSSRLDASTRRHVETSEADGVHVVRIVRSGGVDWLYAVTALMLLAATTHVSSRRLRFS